MHRLINGIVTAIAFIVLMSVICAPAFAKTKDDAVVTVADPILFLQIVGVGSCTGFMVNGDEIVTAGHCARAAFDNSAAIIAKDSVGRTFPVVTVYLDAIHDIAVMAEAGQAPIGPIRSYDLGCDVPVHVGDDISIIGFPLDYGRVTTYGKISALPSAWGPWPAAYRADIFAGPGNSGSPVLINNNTVIGILVGGNPAWVGMSIVVPINELCHPRIA